ncbi:type I restriction endonuclease subunit R [Mycoplasmopsis gallinarum]
MIERSIVLQNGNETVVYEYEKTKQTRKTYESESELENQFIKKLQNLGYEYLSELNDNSKLKENLRIQLQKLNNIELTDSEWKTFYDTYLKSGDIFEKARRIQEDYIYSFSRENGQIINFMLIDKKNLANNKLQVINQYKAEKGSFKNRYDVTILLNGLPLIHIELKRRGIDLKEAFRQIERYQYESFWSEDGLFEYVQIFVISNGTQSKYYSNTTRWNKVNGKNKIDYNNKKRTGFQRNSNSFEFTSYWADQKNNLIEDLVDFAEYFFNKDTILNILTKYCVLTVDEKLLVLRPYQIVAVEKIARKIAMARNNKVQNRIEAGGFIWHTTGSGKTLTSFKAAQLLSQDPQIDKVVYVVDRRDLDYQTLKEFNRFKEGSVNHNVTTKILQEQIEDNNPDKKIIVTTIQKLDKYVKSKTFDRIKTDNREFVLIFDECHRSMFGQMRRNIFSFFKKSYIFGFTGTPILKENAIKEEFFRTTEELFGQCLHHYTILDAIRDKNVLPFKVDYSGSKDINLKEGNFDKNSFIKHPQRISSNVKYVLENYNRKTHRSITYKMNVITNIHDVVKNQNQNEEKRIKEINGFNSIFATHSIENAIQYYQEFKRQQSELAEEKKLKIALIYTYHANDIKEDKYDSLVSEGFAIEAPTSSQKDVLAAAIKDYNEMFKTDFDLGAMDGFQNYYKDVSLRLKNRELDMLIVVNMFLTGFDAPSLNTLWVDKGLRYQGLLQAYSRTNRIFNEIKNAGNVVALWDLKENTDEAITLFSNKEAIGIVTLKPFEFYYEEGDEKIVSYVDTLKKLKAEFPLDTNFVDIKNNVEKSKDFIKTFNNYLKLKNLLVTFDEFDESKEFPVDNNNEELITEYDIQNYNSRYLDLNDAVSRSYSKREAIQQESIFDEEIVFLTELIAQDEINVPYILNLLSKLKKQLNEQNKAQENRVESNNLILNNKENINKKDEKIDVDKIWLLVESTPLLRDKKGLLSEFMKQKDLEIADWNKFVSKQFKTTVEKLVEEENLKEEKVFELLNKCFEKDSFVYKSKEIKDMQKSGTFRFGVLWWKHNEEKNRIIEKLHKIFKTFNGAYAY